jgi:hypothetical protein
MIKHFSILLLCLIALRSHALVVKSATPQLHSPIAAASAGSIIRTPLQNYAFIQAPADAGPTFRRTTFRDGAHYYKVQNTAIVLTVIGLIIAILGGFWVKSEADAEERQKAVNNGTSYNGLNQLAAGFVLTTGIVLACVGTPILLTHL